MTKQTPKSCSCRMCRYSKASEWGHFTMKKEERAFRHEQNTALRKGSEDILNAGMHQRQG